MKGFVGLILVTKIDGYVHIMVRERERIIIGRENFTVFVLNLSLVKNVCSPPFGRWAVI
jgi:hypothetical protein